MGEVRFNGGYLGTSRGMVRLIQIVLGIIVSACLCTHRYLGIGCFGEGRVGYATGLNFVFLIINIIVLLLNICNVVMVKLEKIYAVIGTILFLIASILMVWYVIAYSLWNIWYIASTVSIIFIFLLFLWDFQHLSNYHGDHLPI